jgi:uncharacterized protein YktB (UPF0637 family)
VTLPTLGFRPRDFEVFSVEGFSARMELIYRHVRPRLVKLGKELAPELSRKLHLEFCRQTCAPHRESSGGDMGRIRAVT